MEPESIRWIQEAIALALVRLNSLPESQGKDRLVSDAESLGREVDEWRDRKPSNAEGEDVRIRVISLHWVLAKAPPRARVRATLGK